MTMPNTITNNAENPSLDPLDMPLRTRAPARATPIGVCGWWGGLVPPLRDI